MAGHHHRLRGYQFMDLNDLDHIDFVAAEIMPQFEGNS
jgi:hypothetical protein